METEIEKEIKTNLFKIYTEDSKILESYDKICDKLGPVNELLDDDMCNSAILENQSDVFNIEYLQNLNSQVTFNIVDLIPLETLRRSIDSLSYDLISDNVTQFNLTLENQVSNFTDSILTGPIEKTELSINDFKNNSDLKARYSEKMLNYLIIAMDACMPKSDNVSITNNNNDDVDNNTQTMSTISETGSEAGYESVSAVSASSSAITESELKQLEPKKKYHYNDLFNYCVMYYLLYNITNPIESETTYADLDWSSYGELKNISHKDEDETIFINAYEKAKNYIITYVILLQLFPALTTYASSTKIRENIFYSNSELKVFFQNLDKILLNAYSDKPLDSQQTVIEDEDVEEIQINNIITKITELIKNTFQKNQEIGQGVQVPLTPITMRVMPKLTPGTGTGTQFSGITEKETQQYKIKPTKLFTEEVPGQESTGITKKVGEGLRFFPSSTSSYISSQLSGITDLPEQSQIVRNKSKEEMSKLEEEIKKVTPFGKMKGGSCKHIDLRNELLFIKFLFEWSHDFGPNRAAVYINGDYTYEDQLQFIPDFYRENGIFQQIVKGWKHVIEKSNKNIDRNYKESDIEVDKNIFDRLSDKNIHHEESTYIYNIIDALVTYCSNIKDDLLYIPVAEFTCKTSQKQNNSGPIPKDTIDFFTNIFKYYNNQRMFIKGDDTNSNIHLSITSDNTPTVEVPTNINFGYNMQDMNLDPMSIALISKRNELYKSYDELLTNTNPNDINAFITKIFSSFKTETASIINTAKKDEIKTVAKMLDPLPSGKFSVTKIEEKEIIAQDFFTSESNIWSDDNKIVLDDTLNISTIYGINQLLNVWIDNKVVVKGFTYITSTTISNNMLIEAIKFIANTSGQSSSSTDINSFDWYYGDCTVNVVCGALINVSFNMIESGLKYDTILNESNIAKIINAESRFAKKVATLKYQKCKEQWSHIYLIAKFIMFHPNFRTDYFGKTVQTFLMIISYLKSCGDEYQRLTCESINYLINNDYSYLVSSLPDYYKTNLQNIGDKLKNIGNFSNIFFLTKDRILIGESIEKNTPLFTNLKTPHDAFYDDESLANDFYKKSDDIKGSYLSKKGIGLMSNRRSILTSASEKDYGQEIDKNKVKIEYLLRAIMLKTNPENYKELNIDNKVTNITEYYTELKRQINKHNKTSYQPKSPGSIMTNSPEQSESYSDNESNNESEKVTISTIPFISPLKSNDSDDETTLGYPTQLEFSQENMPQSQTETVAFSQETQTEESEEDKYNIQLDIISSLTKLLLGLEYYNKETTLKLKPFYEKCISSEISKAVSSTIDSDMLNSITLKNSCKIPGTIDGLDKLVRAMYDEPEVIDKLLESYENANNMFISKLSMYKNIVENFNFGIEIVKNNESFNLRWIKDDLKNNHLNQIFSDTMRNDVISKYNYYLDYVEIKKEEYGKKVLHNIEEEMNTELKKMARSRSNKTRQSLAESSDDEIKEKIIEDLNDFFAQKEELNRQKEDAEAKQQQALEAIEKSKQEKDNKKGKKSLWQRITSMLSPSEAKKQATQAKKEIKSIDKLLSTVSSSIQKLTEKKQKIEIKDSQKTKIFGYETFKNAFDYLLGKRNKEEIKTDIEPVVEDQIEAETEDESDFQSPFKRPRIGGTKKYKRKHYYTKRNKLTNNKKHTKYAKKKNIRKKRITKRQ